MSIGNGELRTWDQQAELSRQIPDLSPVSLDRLLQQNVHQHVSVTSLPSNVVGGPLDGERMPAGTRPGLCYIWDGSRWQYSQ